MQVTVYNDPGEGGQEGGRCGDGEGEMGNGEGQTGMGKWGGVEGLAMVRSGKGSGEG